jgi:curved DNA-binding protein CbpA
MDLLAHLSPEELRLFSGRIAHSLDERPLDLDQTAHRERVAGLLRQVGDASLYDLLTLDRRAAVQEIHQAYERLARIVHPHHALRLGLAGREGVLELLFERATHAYLVLSDPEQRKRYDRELSPEPPGVADAAARAQEAREVARRYFERAASLSEAGDFHFAVELLRQAARTDPRPEYSALLGRLQARNQRWLRRAADSLRRAIALGADDPELPAALAGVLGRIEAGEAEGAAVAAEEVAEPAPASHRSARRNVHKARYDI